MKNNWYVITGAPCSGKTTTLQELEKRGYIVIYESARDIIDEEMNKGKTLAEIRKDELAFQKIVLKRKIGIEQKLSPDELIFFEWGIPDSLAYYELCGLAKDAEIEQAVIRSSYKKVFLLDLLNYEKDYARTENKKEVEQIQRLLEESYQEFPLVYVPVLTLEERADYILHRLN